MMCWVNLKENREDLSVLISSESGKPLTESRGEIAYAASYISLYVSQPWHDSKGTFPFFYYNTCLLVKFKPFCPPMFSPTFNACCPNPFTSSIALSGMLIWHQHQLGEKFSLVSLPKGVLLFEDLWVSWLSRYHHHNPTVDSDIS